MADSEDAGEAEFTHKERLARRVLRNPHAHPDEVRAARYLLCVLERERTRANGAAGEALPPLP